MFPLKPRTRNAQVNFLNPRETACKNIFSDATDKSWIDSAVFVVSVTGIIRTGAAFTNS
jgi:hypothetical protein